MEAAIIPIYSDDCSPGTAWDTTMLKKFHVKNFKQFKDLTLDFSDVRDYCFQQDCLTKHKKPLIKTAVIYGPNASGKSNLGFAIFDILQHLVDKNTQPQAYDFYLNADNPDTEAEFTYTFLFNGKEVVYSYSKKDAKTIISEKLIINTLVIFNRNKDHIETTGLSKYNLENLNLSYLDSKLSLLRYIANNSALPESSPIRALMNFVNKMLWFRRVDKNNNFIGYHVGTDRIDEFIIKNDLTNEFQKFLNKNQVSETLTVKQDPTGKQGLYFAHKRNLPFFETASSGTLALSVYFYWQHFLNDVSFLFMDEFDAFYHFEIAEDILKRIKKIKCQTIVTTHNTGLLSHKMVRPDVCFVMKSGILKSFPNLTDRELREGNNLEKLFISGEFDD